MAITINGTGSISGLTSGAGIDATALSGQVPDANAPSGSVIQVVTATISSFASTTATIPLDDTIPQNTEGAEFLTCSITPSSSSSKLYIDVVFNTCVNAVAIATIALFQDSTANALISSWGLTSIANAPPTPMTMSYSMTAGTTSSTTFKVRGGANSAGTFQVNGASGARYLGGSMISFIRITEVSA
jgi:hypothetical protein